MIRLFVHSQTRSAAWRRGAAVGRLATLVALGWLIGPAMLRAQGNLSTQGFGYPPGQLSTSSLAVGGAFGEFDTESPLNPAAIATLTRATLHTQYDPEIRSVSTPTGTDHTTTARFPVLTAALPITSRFVLGMSFSTLLDRTWATSQTANIPVGDTLIASTQTFKSAGGIEDLQIAGGWTPFEGLHLGLGFHAYTGQNQITVARDFPDTTVVKAVPFSESSTYNYVGLGLSAGVEVRASPNFLLAGSAELGGTLRVHRNDTLQSKGTVPPRLGAGIRYDGIAGVTIGARAEWQGWSQMSGMGSTGFTPHDGWTFGAGAEVVGPRIGDRGMLLRIGAQTRTLPFLAAGAVVRENDLSGGLGIPFGGQRAAIDLTVQRAFRSNAGSDALGVSEAAWMLSLGLTVRP
jgi:hypothetical protein